MIAPSTWLKKALEEKTGEKPKPYAVIELLKILDEEMLDGLVKHVQEKEKDNFARSDLLDRRERELERKEKEIEIRVDQLNRQKAELETLYEIKDERAQSGYMFAKKIADLLWDAPLPLQESMSYMLWAYFGGSGRPWEEKEVVDVIRKEKQSY